MTMAEVKDVLEYLLNSTINQLNYLQKAKCHTSSKEEIRLIGIICELDDFKRCQENQTEWIVLLRNKLHAQYMAIIKARKAAKLRKGKKK